MGDTGSMALGGALAAFAIMTKTEFLLLLIGGIFLIEALSVILQVFSFKYFGRRIFLMAPIHHHFEMKAWSETKIMVRFWIVDRDPVRAAASPSTTATSPSSALSELSPRLAAAGARPRRSRARGRRRAAALERRGVRGRSAARPRRSGTTRDLSLLDGVELLVKSPGVPREAPLVAAARARGIPVWSEVELGYRLLPNPLLGVTGTNGKTTTTELLGAMFRAAAASRRGQRRPRADRRSTARSAGRAGSSASSRASSSRTSHELRPRGRGAAQPRARPPRPPRHASRRTATRSCGSSRTRRADDVAVVPRGFGPVPGGARRVEFSADDPLPAEPRIPGAHNRENAAAATAAARAAGIADDAIAEALRTFPGVAAPARAGRRDRRRALRQRLEGDEHRGRAARARRLRRAAARDPRRLAARARRSTPLAARARRRRARYLIGETADELAAALDRAGVPYVACGDLATAVARRGRRPRGRARSCCSRRPARATTSSATSSSAARSSGGWCRTCPREGAGSSSRTSCVLVTLAPRRVRARDGLQRDLGVGRARRRRPDLLPQAAGRSTRCSGSSLLVVALARRLPGAARARAAARRRQPRAAASPCSSLGADRQRRPPLARVRPARPSSRRSSRSSRSRSGSPPTSRGAARRARSASSGEPIGLVDRRLLRA